MVLSLTSRYLESCRAVIRPFAARIFKTYSSVCVRSRSYAAASERSLNDGSFSGERNGQKRFISMKFEVWQRKIRDAETMHHVSYSIAYAIERSGML